MNPHTFSQCLTFSPIIVHVGIDMWSLRGVKLDVGAIEALRESNAARPTEKRVIDHGWSDAGDLWIATRLSGDLAHWVLGIPAVLRRFVAGREYPVLDEAVATGFTVRINAEGLSYGYSPFLLRRGADADDILLITFQMAAGKASLRLIDDEELEGLSPTL